MNQLKDDLTLLKEEEAELLKKLFQKRNREEKSKKDDREAIIRQARKWKAEAIKQKRKAIVMEQRAKGFADWAHERNKLFMAEREEKTRAQSAAQAYRATIFKMKGVEKVNKKVTEQAKKWKERAKEKINEKLNLPQIIRENESLREKVTELERKLKAAQRKASLVDSDRQKLKNAEEEIRVRTLEMKIMASVLNVTPLEVRLESTLVKEIMKNSYKNFNECREAQALIRNQKNWMIKMKKELDELKVGARRIVVEKEELKMENEKIEDKLKEVQSDLCYVEYLHDEMLELNKKMTQISILSPDSVLQPMAIIIQPEIYWCHGTEILTNKQ